VVHEVELDRPLVDDDVVPAASGHGLDVEAEKRISHGLGGLIPFGEDGIEGFVPRDDVEVYVGVEVRVAPGEGAAQDQAGHPLVVAEVGDGAL